MSTEQTSALETIRKSRSAKLVAVTETRRALSCLVAEQTLGLRDDINEQSERLLMALYDAGAAAGAAQMKP